MNSKNYPQSNIKISVSLFICTLLAFIILIDIPSAHAKGETGNGGGAICLSNKCLLLSEAGLRIKDNSIWTPSTMLVKEVEDYIKSIPNLPYESRRRLLRSTFGRMLHFRTVEVIDPLKIQKIKQLYLSEAKAAGFAIDPNKFEVVAISSDDTATESLTYLLPKFFTGLTLKQQAKTLVHEGHYRGQPASKLRDILRLEGAIEDYLNSTYSQPLQVSVLIAALKFGLIDKFQFFEKLFFILDVTNLRDIGIGLDQNTEIEFQLYHDAILDYASLEPRLPAILSKINLLKFQITGECKFENRGRDFIGVGAIEASSQGGARLQGEYTQLYNRKCYNIETTDFNQFDFVIP